MRWRFPIVYEGRLFALVPVRMTDGEWIWLEWYLQRYGPMGVTRYPQATT